MRIVLDTKILARAAAELQGSARQVLGLVLEINHTLITSDYLRAELLRVLHYDRVQAIHGLAPKQIQEYLTLLRAGRLRGAMPDNH